MEHIREEEQIIWEIKSLDIWLNVFISFKSSLQCAVAHIKMKIENNLSSEKFRNTLQKLGIVLWNKFCYEKNMNQKEMQNSSISKPHQNGSIHYYDKRILTKENTKRKVTTKSKTAASNLQGKTANLNPNEQGKIVVQDVELYGILEEDDEFAGDFGYSHTLENNSSMLS